MYLSLEQPLGALAQLVSPTRLIFNVRTLTNKTIRLFINDIISEHNLDFMFLTETWLSVDGTAMMSEKCPPGYNYFYSIMEGKKGGRLASAENICFKNIAFGKFTTFEYLAVVVMGKTSTQA